MAVFLFCLRYRDGGNDPRTSVFWPIRSRGLRGFGILSKNLRLSLRHRRQVIFPSGSRKQSCPHPAFWNALIGLSGSARSRGGCAVRAGPMCFQEKIEPFAKNSATSAIIKKRAKGELSDLTRFARDGDRPRRDFSPLETMVRRVSFARATCRRAITRPQPTAGGAELPWLGRSRRSLLVEAKKHGGRPWRSFLAAAAPRIRNF